MDLRNLKEQQLTFTQTVNQMKKKLSIDSTLRN